jgi:hypothetical protein
MVILCITADGHKLPRCCHVLGVHAWLRGGFWSGFIDTLYTALGTTGSHIAVTNLRTLQFTDANALGFSVCYILH